MSQATRRTGNERADDGQAGEESDDQAPAAGSDAVVPAMPGTTSAM